MRKKPDRFAKTKYAITALFVFASFHMFVAHAEPETTGMQGIQETETDCQIIAGEQANTEETQDTYSQICPDVCGETAQFPETEEGCAESICPVSELAGDAGLAGENQTTDVDAPGLTEITESTESTESIETTDEAQTGIPVGTQPGDASLRTDMDTPQGMGESPTMGEDSGMEDGYEAEAANGYLAEPAQELGSTSSYNVVIPDSWDAKGDASFTVSWDSFQKSDELSVLIQSENGFQLKNTESGDGIHYQLFANGQHAGNLVFSGQESGNETILLHIEHDAAIYAGVYSDTLSFTIEFNSP